jgi:hypothetical protein
MFLRATTRKKDGKEHRYYSVVENKRVDGGRVLQRHVLYLGEINSSQELAWRRSIEVFDEADHGARTLALFPEDRCEGIVPDESIVRLKLGQLRLERPRQWGACWLTLQLWRQLGLDEFWSERLLPSRKGTRFDQVLFVLVAYRLLSRAVSGACIGTGMSTAHWAICWALTPHWPTFTRSTAVTTGYSSTSRRFDHRSPGGALAGFIQC